MKRENLTREPSNAFIGLPTERKSYDEIIDFFARGASSAEVLAFRPSPETQERVRYLRERNAEGELTEEEAAEFEFLGELHRVLQLVRIRAEEYLRTKT